MAFIKGFLRNLLQGMITPFRTAAGNVSLLWILIKRDITARTSGTVLGGFWPVIQPALQVLGFWFLFDVVYGARLAAGQSFLEYLLVGILPWLCMAEVLSRSANMLMEFSPLYKRNPFPLEILPLLIMVIPGFVFTIVYFFVNLAMFGLGSALWSLVVIPALLLWLLPLSFLFPVLGLFVKDFAQAVPFLLMLFMYATPILYFPDMIPETVRAWLLLNPVADLMALVHGVVQGMEMNPFNLARPLILWVLLMAPAWLIFRRSLPHVREVL